MGLFKRKYRLVIILIAVILVLEITLGNPVPSNEMVEHLVREANTERDVNVETVEILEHGDWHCDNMFKLSGKCRWAFRVQVVKYFNPGNEEIIRLVHQKTVAIQMYRGMDKPGLSTYHCLGCDTGLASDMFVNK